MSVEATEVRKLTELEQRHWWYAERRSILRRMLRGVDAGGRAADIGAAGGGNTLVLAEAGMGALAVEYSEDGARVARDRGVPVVRADATRLPLANASLDVVVAFDVLEHIEDDAAAVAEIGRVLRGGGRALIAVPADPSLWSSHDEAVGHVRRYRRQELVELLTSGPFAIEDIWSWNVLMRPVVKARRGRRKGSDLADVPRAVNAVLRAAIMAERLLPVRSLRGVSLMLVARRLVA